MGSDCVGAAESEASPGDRFFGEIPREGPGVKVGGLPKAKQVVWSEVRPLATSTPPGKLFPCKVSPPPSAKGTLTQVTFDHALPPGRVALVEEPAFLGLHLPAKHPLPATASDPGAGEPVHHRLLET